MNCTHCNDPSPAHELHGGFCSRCLWRALEQTRAELAQMRKERDIARADAAALRGIRRARGWRKL